MATKQPENTIAPSFKKIAAWPKEWCECSTPRFGPSTASNRSLKPFADLTDPLRRVRPQGIVNRLRAKIKVDQAKVVVVIMGRSRKAKIPQTQCLKPGPVSRC